MTRVKSKIDFQSVSYNRLLSPSVRPSVRPWSVCENGYNSYIVRTILINFHTQIDTDRVKPKEPPDVIFITHG